MRAIRIGRASVDGAPRLVAGEGDRVVALPDALDARALLLTWGASRPLVEQQLDDGDALDAAGLTWLPPVVPAKLICIGTNFSDHIAEMEAAGAPTGQANPWPFGFLKPASTSLVGDGAEVPLPDYAVKIDWEAELAVVIGDTSRIDEDPLSAVFAYGVVNDLSVRDHFPFPHALGLDAFVNKGFDGSAPMGRWLVPAEQVPDPQALPIRLRVNGTTKQDSTTANMIFGVREILTHYAKVLTLEPGDVIATGTPAGVGAGRRPQEFLVAGDVVAAEVEGVGTVRTTMTPARRRVHLT